MKRELRAKPFRPISMSNENTCHRNGQWIPPRDAKLVTSSGLRTGVSPSLRFYGE
jgi:hypothetical protein